MSKYIKILSVILLIISVNSCLIVKKEIPEDQIVSLNLSPLPDIEMSDKMVRSDAGDIIAFLPQGWFLINVEDKAPTEVMAVASNPEYTLCAVFSKLKKNERNIEIVKKEGLLGLARISLERRINKTAGAIVQLGNYSTISMGPRNFAQYEFAAIEEDKKGIAAVCRSSLNEFYEISLVPMNFKGIEFPDSSVIRKTFNSILTTVQY